MTCKQSGTGYHRTATHLRRRLPLCHHGLSRELQIRATSQSESFSKPQNGWDISPDLPYALNNNVQPVRASLQLTEAPPEPFPWRALSYSLIQRGNVLRIAHITISKVRSRGPSLPSSCTLMPIRLVLTVLLIRTYNNCLAGQFKWSFLTRRAYHSACIVYFCQYPSSELSLNSTSKDIVAYILAAAHIYLAYNIDADLCVYIGFT